MYREHGVMWFKPTRIAETNFHNFRSRDATKRLNDSPPDTGVRTQGQALSIYYQYLANQDCTATGVCFLIH